MDEDSDCYPAPYGRSCTNCAQSKCKCMYPKAGGRCRRCERLNKDCHQPSSHKRKSAQRVGAARAARLEEKLDDLVSLLRAGVQPPGADSVNLLLGQISKSQDISRANALSTPDSIETAGDSSSSARNSALPPPAVGLTPSTNASDTTSQTSPLAEPTSLWAEECLAIFQTNYLPFFPCLYIPPGTTAEQINQKRPFTWLCILAATSKHSTQRRALSEKIKSILAQRMMYDHENTDIDILHGLLIFLGWSNQQVHSKANVHVYTQLVKAAVFELGIHNPSAKSKMMPLCVHTEGHEDAPVPGSKMEERRAVLAGFLVTSIISTFLQKIDGLRWTPFMEQYLSDLEENPDCFNDEILAHQVRLQLIINGINCGQYQGLYPVPDSSHAGSPFLHLNSLHERLENIKCRLMADSLGYKTLLLHHHYATLSLHESALTNDPTNDSRPLSLEQLRHHYACLDAARSWFELFFTIPPLQYIGFPFSIFSQMVHSLVVLYQLSTFENDLWNIPTVRETADVLSILENVIQNMSQVAPAAGLEGEPGSDAFSVIAQMYRSVQVGWEIKLGPDLLHPEDAD